jgi:hypothetical protein
LPSGQESRIAEVWAPEALLLSKQRADFSKPQFLEPQIFPGGLQPMSRKTFAKTFLFYVLPAVLISMGGFTLPALGQVSFQTRYTVVVAESPADLLEMERRPHFPTTVSNSQYQMTTGEFAFHPGLPRLAAKIDAILVKTSQILNIQPSPQSRLHIILMTNGKEVRHRY